MVRHKCVGFLPLGAAVATLMVVAAGCGNSDDLPRQPVSGRVTFDGEPLTKAWIQFRPEGPGGVTATGAMIEDGSYSVSRAEGLIPGNYRVVITKAEEPDAAGKPGPAPKGATNVSKRSRAIGPVGFAKQLIPEQYNLKSKLTAKVEEGQTKSFDFELTSK